MSKRYKDISFYHIGQKGQRGIRDSSKNEDSGDDKKTAKQVLGANDRGPTDRGLPTYRGGPPRDHGQPLFWVVRSGRGFRKRANRMGGPSKMAMDLIES